MNQSAQAVITEAAVHIDFEGGFISPFYVFFKERKFKMKDKLNLTLLTDFYEFTMSHGFFKEGVGDRIAYFDMFFRNVPSDGGFAIMAGVGQLIDYLKNLKISLR